jgi:hypothetical protein
LPSRPLRPLLAVPRPKIREFVLGAGLAKVREDGDKGIGPLISRIARMMNPPYGALGITPTEGNEGNEAALSLELFTLWIPGQGEAMR